MTSGELTYAVVSLAQAFAFGLVFAILLVLLRAAWRRPL